MFQVYQTHSHRGTFLSLVRLFITVGVFKNQTCRTSMQITIMKADVGKLLRKTKRNPSFAKVLLPVLYQFLILITSFLV